MTLTQKLQTIASPKLPSFSDGTATTIEEYWQKFIEPRLPSNIDVVIEWHKVLKEYVKKPDAVLAFRTGNERGKLRRGWETITNEGYSFFYTDNYFSHYFYKLAHDGDYVPNLEEFYIAMKSKKFPVRISSYMGTADDPHEREYAAFDVDGKNPGLGTAGYKLAHIIDAGRNYFVNNQLLGLSEICNTFFNLGEVSDWKKNPKTNLYCRENFVIAENNKEVARQLAEASFLRMVHPMNYFLSPKSKNAGKTYNEYCLNGQIKNNIAEEAIVLDYVKQKFHERYTKNGVDYFKEFLDLIYCKEDFCKVDGKIKIDIHYSALGLHQNHTNAQVSSINKSINKTFLQNNASMQINKNNKEKSNFMKTYQNYGIAKTAIIYTIEDLLNLKENTLIHNTDVFVRVSSDYRSGYSYNGSYMQGINWITNKGKIVAGIIKSKVGCYPDKNDEYAFKARKGIINLYEQANQLLVNQQIAHYPLYYFIKENTLWRFVGKFKVVGITKTGVKLDKY